jgi:hypothetical protein
MLLLAFSKDYNQSKAHNMLVIMLGPRYKNMKCIQIFIGNSIVVQIVVEYNVKMQLYNHLNLAREPIELMTIENNHFFKGSYVD